MTRLSIHIYQYWYLFILWSIVKTVQEDSGALVDNTAVRYGGGHAVDGRGAGSGVSGVSHDTSSDLGHIFDELLRHPWQRVAPGTKALEML